jgi:hypothetical protein
MTRFGRKKTKPVIREKRRTERSSADVIADVETPASREPVTILDISAGGARLLSSSTPTSRRDVQLSVNGLSVFGAIVWRKENCFGLRFDDALNEYGPDEIQQAVKDAEVKTSAFDREAVLQKLANQPATKAKRDRKRSKADGVGVKRQPTRPTSQRNGQHKAASKND